MQMVLQKKPDHFLKIKIDSCIQYTVHDQLSVIEFLAGYHLQGIL